MTGVQTCALPLVIALCFEQLLYLYVQLPGLHAQTWKICMCYQLKSIKVIWDQHMVSKFSSHFITDCFITYIPKKIGAIAIFTHMLFCSAETHADWQRLKKWIAGVSKAECPFK